MNAREYLERIPLWADKKNSLDSIRDFLSQMGNPEEKMRIIHVAGTNGKGSVCQYMTSVLCQAGFRVGTFVSPHLEDVTERFLLCGNPVEQEEFERAFGQMRQLAEAMAGRGYAPPTYFEFLFYMFMDMGERWKPDVVILETGLGGLKDTTNVVDRPLLSVITSISMDHMQYLGNTIQDIAAQKAGILKYKTPVIYDAGCQESRRVIEDTGRRLCCTMYPVEQGQLKVISRDKVGTHITANLDKDSIRLTIPSQADYQVINAGLAIRSAQVIRDTAGLRVSPEAIAEGIRTSCWPGRMEQVFPGVFLDGAHNAGGMEALTRAIREMQKKDGRPVSLMFGVAEDKEYHKMIGELCSHIAVSRVIVAHMDTKRSASPNVLAREFAQKLTCPVEAFDTVKEAWERLLATKGDGLAFCAGSLYLVGEVEALLEHTQDQLQDER